MELSAAHAMATGLLAEHGLEGWTVELDLAKARAGVCRYATRTIGLSAHLTRLHDEVTVRDTVLHEIAHAIAGPRAGHGPTWRAVARRIGCAADRCLPADAPRVPGAWLGVCPAGHTAERHRRPERLASCATCRPSFSAEHLYEWTHRGRPEPMHPNYVAELEALRTGRPVVRLGPGHVVRIVAPGSHHGRRGVVAKRGRTRYQVRVGRTMLSVPFAGVELLDG
ncbi:SprT-like domain-containing protein [Nocardioides zeae]|uniref:SprT-like domain-containing protein n=1 Tax=Nocardioides imazamoxiresistens TaxID=3231893 RepID=A0ABU3PX02_9ACTN|nr:SprT-like domain-containing protein [Nocardioides zeae]MDT9593684.1 SprT-like domain-containing protein [Nocardioides zeae]